MKGLMLAALLLATPAFAAEYPVKLFAGANAVSFDGSLPSDFELGGTGRLSASPHLSAVGGVFYGVGHSYLRGNFGFRVTATDVDNRDFSIGIGLQYQASSEPAKRPEEWAPDVTVGWRPFADMPKVSVGAQGSYGLDSNTAMLILAVRYELAAF